MVVPPGEDWLLKQPGESRAGTGHEGQLHSQPRLREAHGLQGLLGTRLGALGTGICVRKGWAAVQASHRRE